jgi:hypothetical protein
VPRITARQQQYGAGLKKSQGVSMEPRRLTVMMRAHLARAKDYGGIKPE